MDEMECPTTGSVGRLVRSDAGLTNPRAAILWNRKTNVLVVVLVIVIVFPMIDATYITMHITMYDTLAITKIR